MIGKLLGQNQVQTTARYALLARDTVKASAERIGDRIDNDLDTVQYTSSGHLDSLMEAAHLSAFSSSCPRRMSTAARLCTGAAAQKCTTGIGGSLSP